MFDFRKNPGSRFQGVRTAVAAAAAVCVLAGPVFAQGLAHLQVGQKAPDFTLTGADHKTHSLHDYAGKIVVLEWTNPVCPYTKAKYDAGVMQKLQREAAAKGIVWLSIDTAAPDKPGFLSAPQATRRVAKLRARITAFLIDNDTRLGRAYGARTTPSFFIIDKDGNLAYQGAIDDDAYANGHASRNYVREAINALAAGKPVETAQTRPYGCAVEY